MKRRAFLKHAAVGTAAAAAVASPAVAQSTPQVKWRMAASYPRSLDTIYGALDDMNKRVGRLTDGKFEITTFAAGEIVGALEVFDAVSRGNVECSGTLSSFFFGKSPVYAIDTGLAFGGNFRQQAAWYFYGGGKEILREMFAKQNIVNFMTGNCGVSMGGFYRKEIKTVDDLKGLKFRIGGVGGLILSKLGVVPTQLAPGDIYPALERGAIDAAEWIGPYDDEKLGFGKVAKYYYTPGWWEGSAAITTLVHKPAWEALPPVYKEAFEVAANETNLLMMAKYDVKNPEGLKKLVASGTELRAFPPAVMDACYKATWETFDELAAKHEDFKKVFDHWRAFMNVSNEWFKVAEFRLDAFRYTQTKPI